MDFFLYTEMNMPNCSLVIVFEINLKNSGQSAFPGNRGTPKIEHLNLNCEVNFVTSFLSRVSIRQNVS